MADRRVIRQVRVFRAWRQDPGGGKGCQGYQRGKEWASKRRYSEVAGVWENILPLSCDAAGSHLHQDALKV